MASKRERDMVESVVGMLRAFGRDARGSVALMFAFVFVGLLLVVGVVIDCGFVMSARAKVQTAADAAALAGSRAAAVYIDQNGGWTAANIAAAKTLAASTAQASFTTSLGTTAFSATPQLAVTTTAVSGQTFTTELAVTASVPTRLMSLGGFDKVDIAVNSGAQTGSSIKYYQFVFLVDVSGSMAIGGTSSAIAKLQSGSKYGYCAFACHDPYHYYSKTDYRVVAKNNGIKLKIDYVNTAIQTFFSSLSPALTSAGADSRFSIYTYGTNFSTLQASTSSISTATAKAATIDIEAIGNAASNWGYTKTSSALGSVKSVLTNVGDGSSATARKTYVVFITDGIEDLPAPGTTYGRSTDLDYGPACTTLKGTGATLIAIEATYPSVTGDAQYNEIVAPLASSLAPTLKACATSSSWYFSADDGPAIQSAMSSIVTQITSALRLTK